MTETVAPEKTVTSHEGRPPLCILYGALRSGTTILRLMLDGHPRLACPGEADFLTDFLVRTGPASVVGNWRYDLAQLREDRIFRASRARLPKRADALHAFEVMTRDLHDGTADRLVLVAHRGLEGLLELCPGTPILHLVRDPRDVARSAIGMGWAGNVYHGVDVWLETERAWERCASRILRHPVHEIRYEALVRDPSGTLAGICDFLDLSYDPGMLSYAAHSTYDAPDVSLIEQWRRKLGPRDIGLVEGRVGNLLAARGYSESEYPPVLPGPLDRLGLWADQKVRSWQHRVARHGLRDPLMVALGRRLRVPRIYRSAQRRIDNRTIAKLK